MYHFFADNSTESLKLSRQVQVPGNICQYFKPFQLNTLRFLYSHYEKRESCILNDESGLGKCATTAAFLGVIGRNRKSLIVVQNDDDMITAWQFHLDLFSTLSVGVFNTIADWSKLTHDVYIAKWCTLKSFDDLSKHKFDYIIVDNRGEMLNNSFCLGMLLKNYEKNINVFLSSTDITSDLKLLHNVLRLCGRLDQQYRYLKQFQEKFKLPDLKEVAVKHIDLEDYFLKREQLVDYCKAFRLRRYRYQFEDSLPLVESVRYKNNLEKWKRKQNTKAKLTQESSLPVEEIIDLSAEKNTEELFEQYIRSQQEKSLNLEVAEIISKTTGTSVEECTEISDDPVVMSPLLFISDSDSDTGEAECTTESVEIINLDEIHEETNKIEAETKKESKCENGEDISKNDDRIEEPEALKKSTKSQKTDEKGEVEGTNECVVIINLDEFKRNKNVNEAGAKKESTCESKGNDFGEKNVKEAEKKKKSQRENKDSEGIAKNDNPIQEPAVLKLSSKSEAERKKKSQRENKDREGIAKNDNPIQEPAVLKLSSKSEAEIKKRSQRENKDYEGIAKNDTPIHKPVALIISTKSEAERKKEGKYEKKDCEGISKDDNPIQEHATLKKFTKSEADSKKERIREKKHCEGISIDNNPIQESAALRKSPKSQKMYVKSGAECIKKSVQLINVDEFERKTNVSAAQIMKERKRENNGSETISKNDNPVQEPAALKISTKSEAERKKESKEPAAFKISTKSEAEKKKESKREKKDFEGISKDDNPIQEPPALKKTKKSKKTDEEGGAVCTNEIVQKIHLEKVEGIKNVNEEERKKESKHENKDCESISKNDNLIQEPSAALSKSKKSKKSLVDKSNDITNSSPMKNLRNRIIEIGEPKVKRTRKDKRKKTRPTESDDDSAVCTKRASRSLITNEKALNSTNPRADSKKDVSCETPKRHTRLSKEVPTIQSDEKDMLRGNKCNGTPKRQNTTSEIEPTPSTPMNVKKNTDNLEKSARDKRAENESQIRNEKHIKSLDETPKRKSRMTEKLEMPIVKLKNCENINGEIEIEKSTAAHDKCTKNVGKQLSTENNEKIDVLDRNIDKIQRTPKTPVNKLNSNRSLGVRVLAIAPKGVHGRETRSMGRTTRSCGHVKSKYMQVDLALDIDKKGIQKRRSKNKSNEIVQKQTDEVKKLNCKIQNINKENLKNSMTDNECEDNEKFNENVAKSDKIRPSQLSVLPMSDYEEIQCGQKLTPTLNSGSEQNETVFQKSYDFLVPPTPSSIRNSEYPMQFPPMSLNIPDSELAIVPSSTQNSMDVVVLSSSQDEGSLSSQSSLSRRTRMLKRKVFVKKPEKNSSKAVKRKPTFSEFLAEQNKRNNAAKSPDLFSNCSDIGITCSQTNNKTFEGFKIFGSEVKQLQQQNTNSGASFPGSSSRERSCLDLLEKMFENRKKNTKDVPLCNNKSATDVLSAVPVAAPLSRKKDSLNDKQSVEEDVIFEITNNGTFGSMIRLNSNGEVSPVQSLLKSTQQHNKITNYLIGSTQTEATKEDDADLPRTPSKRLSGTANSNAAVTMKKSPRIKQTTQTTKLTKWFSKNAISATTDGDKTPEKNETVVPKRSPLKRRRLDLSFKK